MKQKPWEIYGWGTGKIGTPERKTTHFTLDNRPLPRTPCNLKDTLPLLTMEVSDRWTEEELKAYLTQIRDALNAAGIVEGTIEPEEEKEKK